MTPVTNHKITPPIHRQILDNGITIIAAENPVADLIAGRIFVRQAGSRWEPRTKAGLANLLATVITKGTINYSSAEIAEQVESLGANLGADTAADYWLLSLKTVTADFPKMLGLVKEILRSPSFPQREVELETHLALQSIRSQQEQPFNVAYNHLRGAMYPDHPYGISVLGQPETLSVLERNDLVQYHQTYFRPDHLIISVSGRFQCAEMVALIDSVFGDWSLPEETVEDLLLPSLCHTPHRTVKAQATQQSIVMLGYLAATIQAQDYPMLKLLSTYLGNGLSSRLFVELREKRGLAYDVSAFYPPRLDASQFVVYIGTAPENTAIALDGLRSEVQRLSQVMLSEAELQAAKNKLLGQYALGKQTNSEIAQVFGWYETLGLGLDFDHQFQEAIAQVTPASAQGAAQTYLTEPYIAIVGPEEAIHRAV